MLSVPDFPICGRVIVEGILASTTEHCKGSLVPVLHAEASGSSSTAWKCSACGHMTKFDSKEDA